jgi:hypothetical protein
MASYFLRLTCVHQVRTGQLAQVICNDSPYLRVVDGPKLEYRALYPAMLCSCSRQTEILVRRLGKLTGDPYLVHGTLLRLGENICRNQVGALTEIRRWCPQCYSSSYDVLAEPLAWLTPLVSRCPTHDIPLETSCAHCGERQRPWRIGPDRKICQKCQRPLTESSSTELGTSNWDRWCQREMLRLIGHVSSPETPDFSSNAARRFIAAMPSRLSNHAGSRKRPIGALRRCVSKWPEMLPRLKTIFLIAASWGTTPLDIFLRPEEAASSSLFDGDVPLPTRPAKRSYQQETYRRCEQRLMELLKLPKGVLLPPAVHVCRELKVSNYFQLKRVDVWRTYMREKSNRLKEYKENKVLLANRYMEKHIDKLQREGKRLHRRNAIAQLVRDVRVPQAVARSALRVCLLRMRMNRCEPA